ncbi:right-handed parallel beta-helix repeat-containing protein [Actinocorallia longicatena]|uniref:Right handed beta helix domain-containing protein n=1 Tax=Actinocorallia longicatena TaxID=111803 RepID=A0ABP6Q0K1_9ACTN
MSATSRIVATGLAAAVAGAVLSAAPAGAAVQVRTAGQLSKALRTAKAGTTIRIAKGVYTGTFRLKAKGTKARPITIAGAKGAVLRGEKAKKGKVLSVDGSAWVKITGITVTNAQKGIMLNGSRRVLIDHVTVHGIGMEAVHFRHNSTDNVIRYSRIYDTGVHKAKFGEGVYIGSAVSNGRNDRSDRNSVHHNTFGPNVRAEAIDVKEYSSQGKIYKNLFDGRGLSGANFADSWIDVKGNGYLIQANKGRYTLADGMQVHSVVKGWGCGNVFKGNSLDVRGARGDGGRKAYGIFVANPPAGCKTTVTADNKVVGGAGLTNIAVG